MMALLMNQFMVSALWFLVAHHTGQRVAKSMATIKNLCPVLASGKGPTTSRPHTLNGSKSGTGYEVGLGALVL